MTPIFITKVAWGEEGPGAERQAGSVPRLLYDRGSQGREPEKKAARRWAGRQPPSLWEWEEPGG